MNLKKMIFGFLIIAITNFPINHTISFSHQGPHTHNSITADAIVRFAQTKGIDISVYCSSQLWYLSNKNDFIPTYKHDKTYHCDDNDIMGCSWRFNQLVTKAIDSPSLPHALRYTSLALHIVQDFYSHSNWVEINNFSYILADIGSFEKLPPPSFLQTGYYPDLFLENLGAQAECYFAEKDAMKSFIYGATHDCMNKDSNLSKRGMRYAEFSLTTLHELAGEYAIKHSEKVIDKIFKQNPVLNLCFVPRLTKNGCNSKVLNRLPTYSPYTSPL